MLNAIHRLTEQAVRNATPGKSPRKLSDGGGLFLLVAPSGAKYWRMGYRFAGKQKLLAHGV
ncbi:MAG: Arm DNA-binding domain-containing protein, partial [Steroidobacteraceae bacterium]